MWELTSLVKRQSAHVLDIHREQEANLASGVHPFDGSRDGMVVLDNPWLSCDVSEPEQLELRVIGHPETAADLIIVVLQLLRAREPCAQRSEVFLQREGVVVLLHDPADVDDGVVGLWRWSRGIVTMLDSIGGGGCRRITLAVETLSQDFAVATEW